MIATSVLYVEDNEDLRDSITMALEAPERDITSCGSGEEALAALAQGGGVDVLMTDVGLPGISGIDLARRVLADKPEQWVVLCSGYDMRAELATLGPNVRVLTKPFELDALERLLDDITQSLPGH
jgi:two-component system cell cycle response regulator CpdR